jgi:hypothetical protein
MSDDDFTATYINFGFVGKLPYRELEAFKEHVKEFNGDLRVIYQKTAVGNIWLTDKRPEIEAKPTVTNITNR